MTKNDRINKNNTIRESNARTRLKRKSQACKTFKFKVDRSRLSPSQSESLRCSLWNQKEYIIIL